MTNETKNTPPLFFSIRLLLTFIIFFGYCFNYMQKIDMGIAIVCMLNHTALRELNAQAGLNSSMANAALVAASSSYPLNTTLPPYEHSGCKVNLKSTQKYDGPFVWTKNIQGLVLSSYFYGYILTQIPGGWLSFKFGGRIVLCFSMGIGSIITLSLPFLARWSYIALMCGLFCTGAAHGAFWPSVSSFWAYWAPNNERARLVGMSSAGAKFGNIFALSFGGYLCINGFDGGWPSIFYLFGLMGIVWSALLFFVGTDSPRTHKFIGDKEKVYILEETKKAIETRKICQSYVPWKAILTSKACWSVFIGFFAHNWGMYLFLTQIPSFLKDVLKFDLKSNGFVSSIPYIASWALINFSSVMSDKMIERKTMTRKNVRRFFVFASTILPAFVIIGLSFMTCSDVILAVVLLTIGVGLDSVMSGAGHLVNINEIAGPYSGILFGIANTFATLPGIISPYIASILTKNHTQKEWQFVFIICAVVYFVGGTIYMIFLEAEIQPWAVIQKRSDPNEAKQLEVLIPEKDKDVNF